ncbi:MAG: hypothetical protein A3J46_05670 [Candidatus Yanofskybacteria bacterium RIFCSPHIGHO2_02_FULL_41_11]|uniref:nicotinamidase n=1 Tax=Candidatus Yanofskybacteria bacterium RIFCSPHIGHO2_02_FULL_41_11 TaxID=1802675 RepID=A0A1F8F725_9BACT|nr:MAG: hypothetical protein A3J46_05670 [Candidatus Yanofskybacteria bacterium RIFCSPHIGHO2_02_FULL_41_11]
MKKALLIVDVQNDFCPGGALAVPDGDQVIEPLNRVIVLRAIISDWLVIPSRDWHPADHCSFKEQGGLWPPHCVQGTVGASFHPNLLLLLSSIERGIRKGFRQDEDSYSAFDGSMALDWDKFTSLEKFLRQKEVTEVYIGGLATDYCVKATALDAVKKGFKTFLLLDACRAVNVNPGDGDSAVDEMSEAGVIITNTVMVINGEDVR